MTSSAPHRSMTLVPQAEETARFSFIVPTLDIPIAIPVAVRTGGDYGLRFTVSNITQLTPLSSAKLTLWGFPAANSHNPQRFPKGSPGEPAGCVGLLDASCTSGVEASILNKPLTDNPTTCSGQPLETTLEVETYQDPEHYRTVAPAIRRSPDVKTRPSTPSSKRARPQPKPILPPVSTSN